MRVGDLVKATCRGPTRGPCAVEVGIYVGPRSLPAPPFTEPVNSISVLTPGGLRNFHILSWDFEVVRSL